MSVLRVCHKHDAERIRLFINSQWRENHPLALSLQLLEWQHLTQSTYHFFVAEENGIDEFAALLGFIPTWQYDEELRTSGDCWAAIWKVASHITKGGGLGFALLRKLLAQSEVKSFAAIGISSDANSQFGALGFTMVDKLEHYYLQNPSIDEYKIAVFNTTLPSSPMISGFSLKKIPNLSSGISLQHAYRPLKTIPYIINRYQRHPIYTYEFYGAYDPLARLVAIFVCRDVSEAGATCVRIVDIFGDISSVPSLYHPWLEILRTKKAEYVDVLNYGIAPEHFVRMGFNRLEHDDCAVIVPNYFEPFVRKNVKIEAAVKADYDYVIFKGDGDQDRPNRL